MALARKAAVLLPAPVAAAADGAPAPAAAAVPCGPAAPS